MPAGVRVNPVRAEQLRVGRPGYRPGVEADRAPARRLFPDDVARLPQALARHLDQVGGQRHDRGDVRQGAGQHRGPGRGQAAEQHPELGGEALLAEGGLTDVVHAHRDADQIGVMGSEPGQRGQLPFEHRGHAGAVLGQVGQRAGHRGPRAQDPGQPPRPPDPGTSRPVVVPPRRQAVPERHIVRPVQHGFPRRPQLSIASTVSHRLARPGTMPPDAVALAWVAIRGGERTPSSG